MNRQVSAWFALLLLLLLPPQVGAAVYTFTNIADTTTPAPFGGTFERLHAPAISGGTVAFRAQYLNAGTQNTESGIFTWSGGPLSTIVKTGDASPSGGIFHSLGNPAISGSTVAFRSATFDAETFTNDVGIFTSAGPLTTIAKNGDAAPPGLFSTEFGEPAISGSTIAFRAGYNNDKKGVVSTSGGLFTSIVTTGDAAPSGTFGFSNFAGDPAISGGLVAFRAAYVSGTGIFTGNGGALTTIVKTGDPAPSGTFTSLGDPSISGEDIAFIAATDGSEVGIYLTEGAGMTTIAEFADSAPVGTFQFFYDSAVAGKSVAFIAGYGELDESGPIRNFGEAIFIGNGGSLTTVLKSGDSLFGSTVAGFGAAHIGTTPIVAYDPGGSGSIAFVYRLADGRFGVARATPVPEPTTIAFLGATLAIGGFSALARQCYKR